ncbi:hypothetical protein, partial [Clostridium perfringens]
FKRKYNLFASVRRFMLLAYVVAIHPMIEITGVLAKGIKKVVLTTGITSLKLHAVYFYFTTLKIFNVRKYFIFKNESL